MLKHFAIAFILLALPLSADEKKPDPHQGIYEDADHNNYLLIGEPVNVEAMKGVVDYFGDLNVNGKRIHFDAGVQPEGKLVCLVKTIDDKKADGLIIISIKDGVATIDDPQFGKHTLTRYAMTVDEAKKVLAERRGGKITPKPAVQENPLAATDTPKPATDSFCGKFTNPRLSLELAISDGAYTGTIQMGPKQYPLTAKKAGDKLTGTFTSGNSSFDVTITSTESGLTLSTGGVDHALARAGEAKPKTPDNPLAIDQPKVTPKDIPSAQGELTKKLCGRWLTRTKDMEVWATFDADGTGRRSMRTTEGKEASEFTWTLEGKRLTIKTKDGDVTKLNVAFESDNTVTIVDDQGDGLRMLRQQQD